jgi:hypothetical protein
MMAKGTSQVGGVYSKVIAGKASFSIVRVETAEASVESDSEFGTGASTFWVSIREVFEVGVSTGPGRWLTTGVASVNSGKALAAARATPSFNNSRVLILWIF